MGRGDEQNRDPGIKLGAVNDISILGPIQMLLIGNKVHVSGIFCLLES